MSNYYCSDNRVINNLTNNDNVRSVEFNEFHRSFPFHEHIIRVPNVINRHNNYYNIVIFRGFLKSILLISKRALIVFIFNIGFSNRGW